MDEQPQSSFFELDEVEDIYQEYGPVEVRVCKADPDFPVELSVEVGEGQTIGLSLTKETIRRIIAEAYIAGVTL